MSAIAAPPRCEEGDPPCGREAAAFWSGVWSPHYVCLACAQRHVNLGWTGGLLWIAALPGSPSVTMIGCRSP